MVVVDTAVFDGTTAVGDTVIVDSDGTVGSDVDTSAVVNTVVLMVLL